MSRFDTEQALRRRLTQLERRSKLLLEALTEVLAEPESEEAIKRGNAVAGMARRHGYLDAEGE